MRMFELAKVIAELTPEQTSTLAAYLVDRKMKQAETLYNYIYAQMVDAEMLAHGDTD